MTKKKVLWIISELFPPDETSTAYIMGEIANAAISEYEVRVICGPEIYDRNKKLDFNHPFRLDATISVIRTKGTSLNKNSLLSKFYSFFSSSRRLYRLAKQCIKDRDKVLLVTNPAPLVVLMSWLRVKRSFNYTILVHDVFPENTIPAGLHMPSFAFAYIKRLFDKAYSKADKLIAIGRDMAEILRNKVEEDVSIEVVENWSDVSGIKPIPFPEGPVKLEYAGNLGRVQGLERLVNELPDGIELHFYGTGAMEQPLKEMKKPNVFFHGPYFRSQQQDVLGSCHVSIVTLAEGMFGLGVPSKTYNILAAGRPIVYFGPENGEIGLMIKEHNIGYIGWPQQWDINKLKEMGARARTLAESSYSKQIILSKFLKALS